MVGDTVFGGFHNFLSLYNLVRGPHRIDPLTALQLRRLSAVVSQVLTARILLSWFPQFARQPVFEPLFIVTNPFFNIFRYASLPCPET